MTTVVEPGLADAAQPRPPWRRRHRWLLRSVSLVAVLGLVGVGVGWLVYTRTYQPLEPGNTTTAATRNVVAIGNGVDQTAWVLTGRVGSQATIDYVVNNTGSHSVTLLGLPTQRSEYSGYISGVRWSNRTNPGHGAMLGLVRQAHDFPVTMAPHSFVFVQVTVTQPRCEPNAVTRSITGIPLRWSAMHVTHTWTLQLGRDLFFKPILICAAR